jgi:hypothetical protein
MHIPLSRVGDVGFEHSLLDRMFGCGTLVIESPASAVGWYCMT